MRILTLLILFGFISCSTMQTEPTVTNNKILNNNNESYELTGNENRLRLRITAVLLQRDDGSGNFSRSRPEDFKVFKTYWNNALKNYNRLVQPDNLEGCYTGLDFWPDALIEFEDRIIEVKNSYAWNNRNTGSNYEKKILKGFSPTENWYLKSLDDSISQAEEHPSIHVYFTNDGDTYDEYVRTNGGMENKNSGVAAGQFPSYTNLTRSSQVHMPGVHAKYFYMKNRVPQETGKSWEDHIQYWYTEGDAKGLTHEIGHDLGLRHSNEYHRTNKCQFSIMSQRHTDARNYIQPTEIKKIHANLTSSNLMQFVTADSHYGITQKLYHDTLWNKERRYYRNFELEKNVNLVVSNKIIMPTNAKIILNRNSKLIIKDKGSIVYPNGQKFDGYILKSNAQIIQ